MRLLTPMFLLGCTAAWGQAQSTVEVLQDAITASADLAVTSRESQGVLVLDAAQHAQRALAEAILVIRSAPAYRPPPPMDPYTFKALLDDMRRSRTNNERMALISRAAARHLIWVDQLLSMMRLFSFSEDQIRVAAAVYFALADPENFDRVYGALPFDIDRRRLALLVASGTRGF